MLIRRAMDRRAALNMGITITLDQIPADEFYAMLLLEEAREQLDREREPNGK